METCTTHSIAVDLGQPAIPGTRKLEKYLENDKVEIFGGKSAEIASFEIVQQLAPRVNFNEY